MTRRPDELVPLAEIVLSALPDDQIVRYVSTCPVTVREIRVALDESRVSGRFALVELWRAQMVAPPWLADVERVLGIEQQRSWLRAGDQS